MVQSTSLQGDLEPVVVEQQRLTIENSHGEKLVGVLHETGSKEIVILSHGFRSTKETSILVTLADALSKHGISVFRFDFAGNGESEGSFDYGNFGREVEDIRSVVLYFSGLKRKIAGLIGHSKGGNLVLLYASKYKDVSTIVNISGRYHMEGGIQERLGEDYKQKIEEKGFIEVKDKEGNVEYRVSAKSLEERIGTDMHAACRSIANNFRVLTVHGSSDKIVKVGDAKEFAKVISNHQLHIIKGANHGYNKHQAKAAEVVLGFIKESLQIGEP